MKITQVNAIPLNVPIHIDILDLDINTNLSVCLARVEIDDGRVGWGLTGITEEEVIASAIERVAGPALIGENPLNTERL